MRLLIVEDKDSFRRLLVQALEGSPWDVHAVGDPAEALSYLAKTPYDVMATDLRLPGMTGLTLLKEAKRLTPHLRVIVMSAFGEAPDIVEAIQNGADDFLPKPFDLDRFHDALKRIRSLIQAPPPPLREPWIAHSSAMHQLEQALHKAATNMLPVLFTGEASVGKHRSARLLHILRHPQAPFWFLPAASLTPEHLATDTLAPLANGTIYLANLEQLPAKTLPTLLQALDSEVGQQVHWMAGTQEPNGIPAALTSRFGVLTFMIPPLRERREDILPLFRLFLESRCKQEGRPVPILEKVSEKDLLQRRWPGNMRELQWCADQGMTHLQGAVLGPLPQGHSPSESASMTLSWPTSDTLENMLEHIRKEAEAQLIKRSLQIHSKDPASTAKALGLTTRSLAQRLREHDIPLDESS